MFALPMETAAHDRHPRRPGSIPNTEITTYGMAEALRRALARTPVDANFYKLPPGGNLSDVINWVRVYKNPKTTPATDLTELFYTGVTWRIGQAIRQMPNVATGNSILLPSQFWEEFDSMWNSDNAIWVDFDTVNGDGSLFEDPEKPGESGLVTATENTTVKDGDRVAIAVNFTTWGGEVKATMAIGPRVDITYNSQWSQHVRLKDAQGNDRPDPNDPGGFLQRSAWHPHAVTVREGVWRLNPNLALEADDLQNPASKVPPGLTHTLVYQFVVGPQHAHLNEGPWLKYDFYHEADTGRDPGAGFDPTQGGEQDGRNGYRRGNRETAVYWLYGASDGTRPISSAVMPWNTFDPVDRDKLRWGASGTDHESPGWTNHRHTNYSDFTRGHRHVPMYYPAAKEPIWYPKVVVGDTDVTTVSTTAAITDVPSGTQTGAFQVTLGFSEVQEIADFMRSHRTFEWDRSRGTVEATPEVNPDPNPLNRRLSLPPPRHDILVPAASVSIFVAHNVSADGVATSQQSLTAALAAADPPWTVTALAYTGGIELASSGKEGPRDHGTATRYTLTLSPPLGVKGEFALQIPADAVLDVAGNGHAASETVMVSVDTSLRLAAGAAVEIVEPESGAYLGGDALEVRVPFAADGLTYEGNNPPYITIYLGERTSANARHATWQRGTETSGSTIVPFVYVVNAADPVVSSVLVGSEGLSVPEGTTLMSSSGLSRVGKAAPPKDSGEEAPAPPPSDDSGSEQVVLATDTGESFQGTERDVNVSPVLWVPTEESDPKSAASSVPRTPIVFNELGNGSGDTNDWLELRNVTDAAVSLKDWELSIVADAKQEDTSLVVFPDVSVPANGLLLLTNQPSDKTPLAGGDDVAAVGSDKRRKGLTHLSLVDAGLSLPDDGKFLLILRNAKEKRGLNEAFVDVAGGGGSGTDAFIREQTGLYDTHVWPLQVLEAPGSDTEDSLSAGKVWLRAKADIVGYHRDAWAEAAFSGLGYDRKVSKSAETAGTPGYPNGAVKTEPATPKGAITMSEVMFDSAGGTLPQWIELYNTSKTEALNLNRWELEIQNRKSEDLVGRPVVTLTLQEKLIQPNQTLLIVTGNARASSTDVFPSDRVYNLIELHEKNLRIKTPRDTFLSVEGFYLKLTDSTGALVDEIGNTDGDRRTDDTPAWALPVPLSELEGMRSSLVRRYDNGVAREGTSREGWALAANFAKFKADGLHYGHADDIGTPGYRQGGALPVELSSSPSPAPTQAQLSSHGQPSRKWTMLGLICVAV